MTAESTVAHEAAPPARAVPPSVRWLLLGLTLLLSALAAAQLVYFAPRCLWVMQRYGVRDPGYLRLVLHVPEWSALAAAVAVGVLAFWQRRSVSRSALLATAALAVNVGLLLCVLGGLFQVLSLLG